MQKRNSFSMMNRVVVITAIAMTVGCLEDAGEKAASQLADGVKDAAESIKEIDPAHIKTLVQDNVELRSQLHTISSKLAAAGIGLGIDLGSSSVFFRVKDIAGIVALEISNGVQPAFFSRQFDGTQTEKLFGVKDGGVFDLSYVDFLNYLKGVYPTKKAEWEQYAQKDEQAEVPLHYSFTGFNYYANEAFHQYRQSAQNLASLSNAEVKVNAHIPKIGFNEIHAKVIPKAVNGGGVWHITCELVQRSLDNSREHIIAVKEFGTKLGNEGLDVPLNFNLTVFVHDGGKGQMASK